MTRGLTAAMVTAVKRDFADACHLISLAFSGGTIYYTTASNDITWDGHSWIAVGGNLAINPVTESKALGAQGVRVTLDGVDQTVIAALLAENYIGRTCQIYLLHFDTDGSIVADPYLLFEGLLNSSFEITQTEDTCSVSTRFVSPLTRFTERRGIKATVISHQQHFNGDTFWRHLKAIANREIFWGPVPLVSTGLGGGGGDGIGGGRDDRGKFDPQGGEF
jgi:hypothetical protein